MHIYIYIYIYIFDSPFDLDERITDENRLITDARDLLLVMSVCVEPVKNIRSIHYERMLLK